VLAVDADINQHLGAALGLAGEPPALATRLPRIKDYLRGSNAAALGKLACRTRPARTDRPGVPTRPAGARRRRRRGRHRHRDVRRAACPWTFPPH
jgi:hypothetical protein